MSDNTVTWAQLTPGQQAYLDTLARALLAGDEWVDMGNHAVFIGDEPEVSLNECDLIRTRYSDYKINITAAGLLVWQQGQAASVPPRSVWVAMCGDDIISVHTTSENSRLICEEVSGEKLEWETCDVYPDGTRRMVDSSYVYSVEEWRVLP